MKKPLNREAFFADINPHYSLSGLACKDWQGVCIIIVAMPYMNQGMNN